MKKDNCKSMLVNGKVDNDVVAVNPCVPVQFDLFEDVIQSQVIASFNCVNVTLRHKDSFSLECYASKFLNSVSPRVSIVVLQRSGLFERRYTVISNKNFNQLHLILFDFEISTSNDNDFSMLY